VGLPAGPWPTLLDFLIRRFPNVPAAQWRMRLQQGQIGTPQGQALTESDALHTPYAVLARTHGRLSYRREVPHEAPIAAQERVLFEDEALLVIDKPHGLPVVPSGHYLQHTVLLRQRQRLGSEVLVPIHRIDRDTAGLVLLCKRPADRSAYAGLFAQHLVQKTYQAIAPWRADVALPLTRSSRIVPAGHFMLQHEVPGAPNATTHIALLARQGDLGLYELRPVSGQRHQLRVHMATLGLPIVNDGLYPTLTPEGACDPTHPLQLLAQKLAFTDPVTGQARRFESTQRLAWPTGEPVCGA
jgi:tRNA pseudouridine32 synthase/23S rRNA pseudouridine746 synthase